jgi:hypothetical protein
MRPLALAFLAALFAHLAGEALGQSANVPPISAITFPSGSTLTEVKGQVALGGSELYSVAAKAGQTLLVAITAESDVSFLVYAPDASATETRDGKTLIRGTTLPDAGPDDRAKAWVGAISRSGNYLIAITMGESGAVLGDYQLTVSLQ